MGSLNNSAFTVLLGWVRAAAQWLWQAIVSPDGSALLSWLEKHWVAVVAVLCVIGVAADWAVYFFRWRPLEVWRSFFRRRRMRRMRDGEAQQLRRWEYADGSARLECVPADDEQPSQPANEPLPDGESASCDAGMAPDAELALQHSIERRVRRKRSERHRRSGLWARLMGDDGEDQLIAYRPLNQPGDKREYFNAPYYPPQRKRADEGGDP